MADYNVSITDTAFRRWLATVQTGAPLRAGLLAGAVYFKERMSVYPPVRRQKMRFKDAHHRRGFFAKLNAGEIEVPYQRGSSPNSETASKRWTVEARDNGDTQVVGNNASYAELLYSPTKQAGYHKGNWQTTEEVWRRDGQETKKVIFGAAVQSMRSTR